MPTSALDPDRGEGDLPAEPLALTIAAVEIIRQDCQQGQRRSLSMGLFLQHAVRGDVPPRFRRAFVLHGGGMPAILSRDSAILLKAPPKSGMSISASSRPATQKMCIWVNRASRPKTATI